MSWFKKKKEESLELPELPYAPEPPMIKNDFEENEPSPLPSFPNSQTADQLTNVAVKQAINDEESINEDEEMDLPPLPKIMTKEIESQPRERVTREYISRERMGKAEPVYVRLDKYQDSIDTLQEIKKKLLEIENLLAETKELKSKEELELNAWENEIQEAKDKLNAIDRTIFNKLE